MKPDSARAPIVLIVEDEAPLRQAVARHLGEQGFEVIQAATVSGGLAAVWEHQPDVVLLDVLLPDGSGYELCAKLRPITSAAIIYLTALGQDGAVVRGLDAGGDDYMAKPFNLDVLTARINSQLRRTASPRAARIDVPPLHLDFLTGQVLLEGREIDLTKMELQLLGFFATNIGVGATQEELLTSVWRAKSITATNTVRQTVSSLRRKLCLDEASPFELEFTSGKRYVFRQVRFDPPANLID
ncbi:response regulator transcription factor [Propionicimonas sp.]|uniref:response regulator transcription factor n=1 Tax=Propionicimonas sp. TaxID=1955623 RepID=UPI0017DB96F3|nr:response regulator transcription factor [Propionicimonas sp.]MBU3976576.1 response regulator transcription factor [Actinomycetota bacterium]MBA3020424.1 response regulator transcription factor [Propionicimonas sp.]MBU3986597.1 response regulator transcription factor [Actinomycetota bacterium]MBU4007251.1 response regulator transcription factor [Actinomycetota bacterium]MBU4065004.1 response regulator transcription factor [Actinomycetota bacterium]